MKSSQVVGAISTQIDKVLLAAAAKNPLTSLAAYDCWLRGMDRMRLGTPEADAAEPITGMWRKSAATALCTTEPCGQKAFSVDRRRKKPCKH
jgi:hypothetical protein